MRLENEIDRINKKIRVLKNMDSVIIWGAGENTIKLFQYTDVINLNIKYIVDNSISGRFFGIDIKKPYEINWSKIKGVIISSFYREKNIEEELINRFQYKEKIIELYDDGEYNNPFYCHLLKSEYEPLQEYAAILNRNKVFYNKHKGERLFILCCGPSIKQMDLKVLSNENVMAVSNFYLHEDFNIINPKYYCIPQFVFNELFTKEKSLVWLQDLNKRTKDIQFFMSISEKKLIEEYHLLNNNCVNYLSAGIHSQYYENVNLTKKLLSWQSVPIMCLQIAIYMGFQDIYLIGTEHTELSTNKYGYFYDREKSVIGACDISVKSDNTIKASFSDVLQAINELWREYNILKKVADIYQCNIYNATIGGNLDVFERVDFQSLF